MENLRNPRVLGTQYRVYDKDRKYKRTIDKTDEKNLDESDWLKGVTSVSYTHLTLPTT